MLELKKRLIDKKYVHKTKNENVLIYNLRRALPVKINKEIFEKEILMNVNESKKEILLKYYVLHKNSNSDDNKNTFYIMYNIPHIIELESLKNLIKEKIITKEDLKSIFFYYKKDKEKKCYILKNELTEIDEIQILKIFKKKDPQIFDYDKREIISNIFEKIQNFKKNDIFFANMFADRSHIFFFEHSIDHVPAMMIIEGARQFLIALCHIYGKLPIENFSFILSGMQIEFNNYLELNYPIKMIAKINNLKKRKDNSWKNINITIYFYQNNKKCVVINNIGRSISNDLFKKLRKNNHEHKIQPRFSPSGMYYKNISINDKKNKKYLCKIIDISEYGFQLEIENDIFNRSDLNYKFIIFFQEIGFVHGSCELRWYKKNSNKIRTNEYIGGFKINEMDDSDRINFKAAIKKFCYVKTEREYL